MLRISRHSSFSSVCQARFLFQAGPSDCSIPRSSIWGVWRLMEKARTIQGDHSYWKVNYRWGGYPYVGVLAKGNASDSSIGKNVVEFSYTDDLVMPERVLLWS